MSDLRKCCGEFPQVKYEYYPGTKYKMVKLYCRKCSARTGAKRRIVDAEREWNTTLNIHLN